MKRDGSEGIGLLPQIAPKQHVNKSIASVAFLVRGAQSSRPRSHYAAPLLRQEFAPAARL